MKYLTRPPAAHLLLCCPVPDRPWSTARMLGAPGLKDAGYGAWRPLCSVTGIAISQYVILVRSLNPFDLLFSVQKKQTNLILTCPCISQLFINCLFRQLIFIKPLLCVKPCYRYWDYSTEHIKTKPLSSWSLYVSVSTCCDN